jgi:hypothetical protein
LGCIYVLLASGLSIIYGLLDVVNFAHGRFDARWGIPSLLRSRCRVASSEFRRDRYRASIGASPSSYF